MAEIKIDTIKMRDCGNRMMELSLSLNEDFKLLISCQMFLIMRFGLVKHR